MGLNLFANPGIMYIAREETEMIKFANKYYHSIECLKRDIAKKQGITLEELISKNPTLKIITVKRKVLGICSGCLQRLEN